MQKELNKGIIKILQDYKTDKLHKGEALKRLKKLFAQVTLNRLRKC